MGRPENVTPLKTVRPVFDSSGDFRLPLQIAVFVHTRGTRMKAARNSDKDKTLSEILWISIVAVSTVAAQDETDLQAKFEPPIEAESEGNQIAETSELPPIDERLTRPKGCPLPADRPTRSITTNPIFNFNFFRSHFVVFSPKFGLRIPLVACEA